jgi:hypothetical protein
VIVRATGTRRLRQQLAGFSRVRRKFNEDKNTGCRRLIRIYKRECKKAGAPFGAPA